MLRPLRQAEAWHRLFLDVITPITVNIQGSGTNHEQCRYIERGFYPVLLSSLSCYTCVCRLQIAFLHALPSL